jgi:hypothetical protein
MTSDQTTSYLGTGAAKRREIVVTTYLGITTTLLSLIRLASVQ